MNTKSMKPLSLLSPDSLYVATNGRSLQVAATGTVARDLALGIGIGIGIGLILYGLSR